MPKLYVCEEYKTPYEEGYRAITTLEEHDKQIVKETLDKVWKKALFMHDDYVEIEELDNYIDEIIAEMK